MRIVTSMSIITVDWQNTVLYDGRRVSDRIVAASIDSAVRIDVQYVQAASDVHDLLMPHDITPVLIALSPIPCLAQADMEKIAARGYNVLYFRRDDGTADDNVDQHTDVGVRAWAPPALPVAISAGASLMMASLAYTYDGHVIGKVPADHARAFVTELTGGGLSSDEQIRLCAEMADSFSGTDAVSAMIRRGLGRLAEREKMLRAFVRIGSVFGRSEYDGEIAAMAGGLGARLVVSQERVLVVADQPEGPPPLAADACIV